MQKQRRRLVARGGDFATRIHLDRVQGLGESMELEVTRQDGQGDTEGRAVTGALMAALGLAAAPRLSG